MSYQVLARKYRPQRFSDVIGQEHVTRTLKNAIEQRRIAHGYIFSGHRGIGKTTVARILAMALNCRQGDGPTPGPCGVCESCTEVRAGNSVDVIEIDAATNRGIDEIRELREAARYRPARDRYKIYILDEAHQITDAAFNALLKTLEEPPPHIVFMMATTQPEDIPQTIRSRCQHFSFHAVKFDDIVGQLRDIARQEKIAIEEEALAVLAEAGDGSMRDALSIMDQALATSSSSAKVSAETVRGLVGTVSSEVLERLMNSVAANSSHDVLQLIDKLVTEGQSPTHFVRQLVRFLRNAMVAKVAGPQSPLLQISPDERKRIAGIAEQFGEEDLTRFLNIALRTHDELAYKSEQRFHLELGVLKMVHAQRLLPVEQLLSGQPLPGKPAAVRAVKPQAPVTPEAAASTNRQAESERESSPSPFDADRARKGRSFEMSSAAVPASDTSIKSAAIATAAVMATAMAIVEERSVSSTASSDVSAESLRTSVIGALEEAGQGMLANMLDNGDWSLEGSDLTVKVAASAVMIDMSFGPEPKKLVHSAASQAAARPVKVKLVPGGSANPAQASHRSTARATGGGSARSRAADDPLVQYMQEKFHAEIRTVIDHQKKD